MYLKILLFISKLVVKVKVFYILHKIDLYFYIIIQFFIMIIKKHNNRAYQFKGNKPHKKFDNPLLIQRYNVIHYDVKLSYDFDFIIRTEYLFKYEYNINSYQVITVISSKNYLT